jgi:hypothetical protein
MYSLFLHEILSEPATNCHLNDVSPVSLPTDSLPSLYSPVMSSMTDPQVNQSGSMALHALDMHLSVHALSRTEFYRHICAVAPELLGPDAPLRAHTDGGSMATATN